MLIYYHCLSQLYFVAVFSSRRLHINAIRVKQLHVSFQDAGHLDFISNLNDNPFHK